VRDHERRAPLHRLAQRELDRLLGRGVDRGGGIVEHEDPRVGHERAGDRDPLALAAGEREAALADHGVVAVGQLGDEAGRLRALGGPLDLLAGRVRAAVGDVVVHGRAEQERVVGNDADLVPQRAGLDLAHVAAVDQHAALGDVVLAPDQADERRLPGAGGAHERHRRAAVDLEVDVVEDRRAVLIGERDAAQLHAPVARPERPRVRRGLQLRLAVEQLEQAAARGRRALGEAERDAERAHRRDQHQQVRVEGREVAGGEVLVDDPAAADDEDRGEAEVRQEPDEGLIEGAQAVGVHRLVEHPGHRMAEAQELARLGGERLHHAHARDVLLGLRRQLGDALLDLLQRRPRALPVARGDHDHERHRQQRERRQRRVLGEHRHRGEQDGQPALRDPHETVAEEEADRLQVDGRARHQLPGLLAIEEAELERLQVAVETVAQVVLDGERDAAGDDPARDGEAEAQQPGTDHGEAEQIQRVAVARVDLVDRAPDQPRQRSRADHRDAGQHHRPDGGPTVGTEEPEEPEKGAHASTR
jgi:hypothetical protein